jgi:hypothetical protein
VKNIKELARKVFDRPVHLMPGDEFHLTFHSPNGTETLLTYAEKEKVRTFTEGVIIECEYDGHNALGGLFLEPR